LRHDVVELRGTRATAGGAQADGAQKPGADFRNADALLVDLSGQAGCERHAVLGLHGGNVRAGAVAEREGDARGAVEADCEVKYSRLSRPVSCCSMTWVTLVSTVAALAPG